MNKKIFIGTLCISSLSFAQVGMNTAQPKATLDVTAKASTGTSDLPDGILIPRVDRQRAQSMNNVEVSTMVYINSIATGTQTGKAVNIDAIGYYFYDGKEWIKLNKDVNSNLYNTDGTLSANRVVTQADKTLAFTSDAVNGFSVDDNTFSVDTKNNNVGIGTSSPAVKLHVEGSQILNAALNTSITKNAMDINIGQDSYGYGNRTDNYGINIKSSSSVQPGSIARINFGDKSTTTATGDRYMSFSVGKTPNELMYLDSANGGNVGIGTVVPESKLDITTGNNGEVRVKTGTGNSRWAFQVSDNSGTDGSDVLNIVNRSDDKNFRTMVFSSTGNIYSGGNIVNDTGSGAAITTLADGNVGIGTTNPTNKLHVNSATNGALKIVDGTQGANKVLTSDVNGVATWQDLPTDKDTNIYDSDGTLSANRVVTQADKTLAFTGDAVNGFSVDGNTFSVDTKNNNVGIGTTAPTRKLHVEGAQLLNAAISQGVTKNALDINIGQDSYSYGNRIDNYGINIKSSSSVQPGSIARINFGDKSTTTATGDRYMSFSVGKTPNELMYLDSANGGNVGVGTTNPQAKMDVVGNILGLKKTDGSGSWDNLWLDVSNTSAPSINASGAETGMQFKVGKNVVGSYGDQGQVLTTVATMTSDGNVGIGTDAPTTKLDINGNLKIRNLSVSNTENIMAVSSTGEVKKSDVLISQIPVSYSLNSTSIAPGASYTYDLTGYNVKNSMIYVTAQNTCTRTMVATFFKSDNTLSSLGAQARNIIGNWTLLDDSGSNGNVTFNNVTACQDGGGSNQFDFDIRISGNSLILTNRGNIYKAYNIRFLTNM